MEALDYTLLDVFTDTPFAGNPLAVFTDAAGLTAGQMGRIAAELNLSETVFVVDRDIAAGRYALRIMTPATELPFAGHPTVGAAVVLAAQAGASKAVTLELIEAIGPVRVVVEPATGRARFAAPRPPERVEQAVDRADVAALLGLEPGVIPAAPGCWSAGVPFVCVPVASAAALSAIRFDTARWQGMLAGSPAPHVYAYHLAKANPATVQARMFAPAMGIAEDPATGAAAVAFAGELATRLETADGAVAATIHQGEQMGRPSRLELEAEVVGGNVISVHLGGAAVVVGEGRLRPPPPDE